MIDLEKMIKAMNESRAIDRGHYHLTYGELVDALLKAPKNATFDKRVKGIDSWRGSYTEIALFTEDEGLRSPDEEYNGDYSDYDEWEEKHVIELEKLPQNANELGRLLKSLIGRTFTGYKGGNFTITREKPLWLEKERSSVKELAIIGITDDLKLLLKNLREDK